VLRRRGLGAVDGVFGAIGAFADACAIEVAVWDAASEGTRIGLVDAAFDGSFAELPVGTARASLPQVWAEGTDKCGYVTARTLALIGADTSPPAVSTTQLAVERNDFTRPDRLVFEAGALADANPVVRVEVTDGLGHPLGTVDAGTDGTFAPLDIGTADASVGEVFVRAVDKPGNVGAPVEAQRGRQAGPPVPNGSKIVIDRRDLTQRDTVHGEPGAFLTACALAATVWDAPAGGNQLGTGGTSGSAGDGSFPPIAFGTATASLPAVYVEARDKCGGSAARTPALAGQDFAVPVLDASRITYVHADWTARDSVRIASAGIVEANAVVRILVLPGSLADVALVQAGLPDGRIPAEGLEIPIGEPGAAPSSVWVMAWDKAGNASQVTAPGSGVPGELRIDAGKLSVVRRAVGTPDSVRGDTGALSGACAIRVAARDDKVSPPAWTDDLLLPPPSVSGAGAFPDLPVGTATAAPRSLVVRARDKCRRSTQEVTVPGAQNAPTGDPSRLTFLARPSPQSDGISAAAGVFSGPCAAASVSVLQGGPVLATFEPAADGTFTDHDIGDTKFGRAQVYIRDKCGYITSVLRTSDSPFGSGADGDLVVSGGTFDITSTRGGTLRTSYMPADGFAAPVTWVSNNGVSVSRGLGNAFQPGDRALLVCIQASGSPAPNVGNYDLLTVASAGSQTLAVVENIDVSRYTDGSVTQRVIVQRVPQYGDVTITGTGKVTAAAWDGFVVPATGIVAFFAANVANIGGQGIDVSRRGFPGLVSGNPGGVETANSFTWSSGGGDGGVGSAGGSGGAGGSGTGGGAGGAGASGAGGAGASGGGGGGASAQGFSGGGGASPIRSGGAFAAAGRLTLGGGAAAGGGGGAGGIHSFSGMYTAGSTAATRRGVGGRTSSGAPLGSSGGSGGSGEAGGGAILVVAAGLAGAGSVSADGGAGGAGGGGGGAIAVDASTAGGGGGGGAGADGAAGGFVSIRYGSSTWTGTASAAGGQGGGGGGGGAGYHGGGGGGAGVGGGGGGGASSAGVADLVTWGAGGSGGTGAGGGADGTAGASGNACCYGAGGRAGGGGGSGNPGGSASPANTGASSGGANAASRSGGAGGSDAGGGGGAGGGGRAGSKGEDGFVSVQAL